MTLGYWKQFASLMAIASALCACSAVDRLENVGGSPPAMSPIANPLVQAGDQGAPPPGDPQRAASLWQTGAHSFFHDPRASRVGDVITVDVTIADSGQITNTTTTNRTNAETANLTNTPCYYEVVPPEHWNTTGWIDKERYMESLDWLGIVGIGKGWMLSYHNVYGTVDFFLQASKTCESRFLLAC